MYFVITIPLEEEQPVLTVVEKKDADIETVRAALIYGMQYLVNKRIPGIVVAVGVDKKNVLTLFLLQEMTKVGMIIPEKTGEDKILRENFEFFKKLLEELNVLSEYLSTVTQLNELIPSTDTGDHDDLIGYE